MWKKKISKNKGQYILFAFIVFITIAVFSMCFGFVVELGDYSKQLLNEDNSSDMYIMTMHNMELEDSIKDDETFENIKRYITYEGYSISAPIMYGEQNISMLFQSGIKIENIDEMQQFQVTESKGNQKAPKKGEVWLPLILSDPCDIKLGDKITLDYEEPLELEVTGFYKAKLLVTENLGFAPILLSEDDLNTISSEETPIRLYGLWLTELNDDAIADIKDSCLGMSFSVTREQLRSNFEQVANVISNMGAIAAVIIFLSALAIIRYVISNSIISEYKSIGIYKSLGYTDKQIQFFYLNGYMLTGFIATVFGSIALTPFVKQMGDICTKYADEFTITDNIPKVAFTTVGLFMLLIFINTKKSLSMIKKHSTVEIIRDRQSMGAKKIGKSRIRNASSAFAMTVNSLFKHKKPTLLSAFAFMFSVHLAMIFIMIGYSAYHMNENYSSWFAIPENNGYVSGILTDEIVDYMDTSEDIESYVYGSVCTAINVSSESIDKSMNLFNFDVFSSTSTSDTGVKITGESADANDEVVLTTKAMQYLGTKVGDKIKLTINETEKEYTIKGTYSSMFSNLGIMITVDAMQEVNPDYKPYMAFISLKDGVSIDNLQDEMTEQFSGISVDEKWFAIDTALGATRMMLLDISLILIFVFLIFTVISLSIIISINIENKQREGGILKALGFTKGYLMKMNILSSVITAMIGISCAFILHMSTSQFVLSMFMVDAFTNPIGIILLYIAVELLLSVVITILMNRKVCNVSPKILMEE